MRQLRRLGLAAVLAGMVFMSQGATAAYAKCDPWPPPVGEPGDCIPCDPKLVPPYVPNPGDDPCRWW